MGTKRKNRLFLFVLLALLSQQKNSYAFSTNDHKWITLQAIAEFSECWPTKIKASDAYTLVTQNLDEDFNLFLKELFYSHYYNPEKKLQMRRFDSSVRVDRLSESINSHTLNHQETISALAHAIHHLQDMAVPPHVVPVNHWITDGFERYENVGKIASGWNCDDIRSAQANDLFTVLHETASTTLASVRNLQLEIQVQVGGAKQEPLHVNGEAFWEESPHTPDFGKYGLLGNHFGEVQFEENGIRYAVPEEFYTSYKNAQMRQAIRATLRALAWNMLP